MLRPKLVLVAVAVIDLLGAGFSPGEGGALTTHSDGPVSVKLVGLAGGERTIEVPAGEHVIRW